MELHKALFEQGPVGVAYFKGLMKGNQKSFEFVELNAAFENLTGLGETVVGRTVCELASGNQLLREFHNALNNGSPEFQYFSAPFDGWINVKLFSPEKDYLVAMVTELPNVAKPIATAEDTVKSQFMAKMSHEILTPLNSIIGIADLLAETELSETQNEYTRTFQKAGSKLLSMARDILDISNIEAGKLELESEPFNISQLITTKIHEASTGLAKKSLVVESFIDPGVPDWICGDQDRMGQILFNLLDNAIKFTDQGEITLDVRLKPDLDINNTQQVELLFSVRDTGMGISREDLGRVFEEFYQVDSSPTRQNEGSGLGLAITHKLVQLMNGDIWVESEAGEGSTFYFTAWFDIPEAKNHYPGGADTNPLKILLVEDCLENRFLIEHYIKTTPHCLDFAVNGQVAAQKAISDQYDLILMDIQMPIMDGYQATKEIRAWEECNSKQPVPIVALTAYSEEEVKRQLADGFDAHLAKPIRKSTLLRYIGQYSTAYIPH